MTKWGALFLVAFISKANAGIQHTSYEEEGLSGATEKRKTTDLQSPFVINAEDSNDIEDAPGSMNIVNDAAGTQGGGVRFPDPKLLKPKCPQPSWWNCWWNWIVRIFD